MGAYEAGIRPSLLDRQGQHTTGILENGDEDELELRYKKFHGFPQQQ